jgi:hypothetical protein
MTFSGVNYVFYSAECYSVECNHAECGGAKGWNEKVTQGMKADLHIQRNCQILNFNLFGNLYL